MYSIVLGSGSPRRKEILDKVGVKFTVYSSDVEEIFTKEKPEEIVLELASMKAKDVANHINFNSIIIGADTLVAWRGQVMGKPKDEEDAKNMLRKLQGSKHEVYTGVSIIIKEAIKLQELEGIQSSNKEENESDVREIHFVEATQVYVNPMSEEQIASYVASGEPMDKAGAYAIQGKFAVNIGKIDGDYYNIVGFPIARIYSELLSVGINILES